MPIGIIGQIHSKIHILPWPSRFLANSQNFHPPNPPIQVESHCCCVPPAEFNKTHIRNSEIPFCKIIRGTDRHWANALLTCLPCRFQCKNFQLPPKVPQALVWKAAHSWWGSQQKDEGQRILATSPSAFIVLRFRSNFKWHWSAQRQLIFFYFYLWILRNKKKMNFLSELHKKLSPNYL